MKKLVLIVIALVALQVSAQEDKKEHRKGAKKERMHKQMNFTPEEMATLQTKKMVLSLDLTEAQQREIHKINLANAKVRQAKMEGRKKVREDNKEEKPSKEDRYKMMNERLDKQISNKKEMKTILSKEQFEKWEKGHQRGHKRQKIMKQKSRKVKGMKQKSKSGRSKRF